jgi:hypothetical protein
VSPTPPAHRSHTTRPQPRQVASPSTKRSRAPPSAPASPGGATCPSHSPHRGSSAEGQPVRANVGAATAAAVSGGGMFQRECSVAWSMGAGRAAGGLGAATGAATPPPPSVAASRCASNSRAIVDPVPRRQCVVPGARKRNVRWTASSAGRLSRWRLRVRLASRDARSSALLPREPHHDDGGGAAAGTGGSTAMAREKEEQEGLVGWEQGGDREAVLAERGEMRERSVEERLRLRPMVDGDTVIGLVERGILGWIEQVVRVMVVD